MSDGPHRTLKLTKPWQNLAECADKDAFSTEDACVHLGKALVKEGVRLPINDLTGILCQPEQTHLLENNIGELDNLATSYPGPIGDALSAGAKYALMLGLKGDKAVRSAIKSFLEASAQSHCRSIEEHWKRETTRERTFNVREKLTATISTFDYDSLTSQLISKANGEPISLRSLKKQGLDEGPSL